MESRSDNLLEVIDAFVDGERVDATAFKAALADTAGREYLVDAWMLREAARTDSATPTGAAPWPRLKRPAQTRPWVLVAAVASAVIAGFAIGRGTFQGVTPTAAPNPPITVAATTPAVAAFPVPAATRVIQLEFQPSPGGSGGG